MRAAKPEPGDVIAEKYVVEYVLGEGGMGTVYATTHRLTGKRLALKCLLPSYVRHTTAVERFLREARAAGRIQHRHVIDVYDVGQDGDVLFMVMPALEGMSFSQILLEARLSVSEALRILVRAMEGVDAAHAQAIIHRDLKPSNLFVCVGMSGQIDDPRVLDFGISKLDDELEASLTRSGASLGTPCYMAIEQLTGSRDLDPRVDVYAMGVILYETLTGTPPHVADNVAALALRIMHESPVHLHAARPDLPASLCDAVMRAIARERDARQPSIRALIKAIEPHLQTLESASICVTRSSTAPADPCAPTAPVDLGLAAMPPPSAAAEPSAAPRQPVRRPLRFVMTFASLGALVAGAPWVATLRSPAERGRAPSALSLRQAPEPSDARGSRVAAREPVVRSPVEAAAAAREPMPMPAISPEAPAPRRARRMATPRRLRDAGAASVPVAPTEAPREDTLRREERAREPPRAGALLEDEM